MTRLGRNLLYETSYLGIPVFPRLGSSALWSVDCAPVETISSRHRPAAAMRPGHYLPTASWLLPTGSWLLISLCCPVLEAGQLQAGKLCGQGQTCGEIGECEDYSTMDLDHLTLADRKKLNDNICGFNGDEPYVCCKEKTVEVRKPENKGVCGKRVQTSQITTFVAGGEDVEGPSQWPWMARLVYQKNKEDKFQDTTFCGGALVSQRHVVTAAHCVEDPELGEPEAVVLGELDIRMEYDCLDTREDCSANGSAGRRCHSNGACAEKAITVAVQRVIAHGSYNLKGGGSRGRTFPIYDVAVVVLARAAEFSDYILPVCLPDPSLRPSFDSPKQPLTVTGWGNTATGRQEAKSAPVLQKLSGLKETPLENEEAEDGLGCRTLLAYPTLLDHHMCIWKQDGETANACGGDSGGPISRINRKNKFDLGTWDLAGVVSFGTSSACGSRTPLVVTRIEDPGILAWVKEQVGEDMPAYP